MAEASYYKGKSWRVIRQYNPVSQNLPCSAQRNPRDVEENFAFPELSVIITVEWFLSCLLPSLACRSFLFSFFLFFYLNIKDVIPSWIPFQVGVMSIMELYIRIQNEARWAYHKAVWRLLAWFFHVCYVNFSIHNRGILKYLTRSVTSSCFYHNHERRLII